MATIKEIAKLSGVSIATVSNIINNKPGASEETKKRVLAVIKKLNYTPNVIAKSLKCRSSKKIGVITEDLTMFSTVNILDGINEYCDKAGYNFIIGNMRMFRKYGEETNSKKFIKIIEDEIRMMQSNQVEGIIYVGRNWHQLDFIPDNFLIPIVTAYTYVKDRQYLSVTFNDEKAAYEVTQRLIDVGNKNIGLIAGEENNYHTQKRILGYKKALYDNGILFNPNFIFMGDWTRESGKKAMEKFQKYNVTGIFAMNYIIAGGVYDYCYENNLKIGKDISIIGFDNREISEGFYPQLSTMEIPLTKIGNKSAEILLDIINNPDKEFVNKDSIKFECRYIERQSVAK